MVHVLEAIDAQWDQATATPKAEDTEEEDDEPGQHAGIVLQVGHHIAVAVGTADLHRHIRKPHNTCHHHRLCSDNRRLWWRLVGPFKDTKCNYVGLLS